MLVLGALGGMDGAVRDIIVVCLLIISRRSVKKKWRHREASKLLDD